ncbi:cuticular protein RR-1 family member 54 precursor [Nasonia vitripennis]|uniref:Uncharacterized protein n=1 Tax=Nasonia vitripennis TaxID=7425 RepID=A0A7M6UFK1_NASVI|nr:cuticular protein RR-1 family member 54 precursor [Nasonia vitripennis]
MKFIIAALALVAVIAAQEQHATILRQSSDISPEGSYSYSYETDNGISHSETGDARVPSEEGLAVAAAGQYQYTAPDGNVIQLSYTADENGFQPQGAHLPVAPEIPQAILRAIEYIRSHPQPQQ